jgi:hypothetical protein
MSAIVWAILQVLFIQALIVLASRLQTAACSSLQVATVHNINERSHLKSSMASI